MNLVSKKWMVSLLMRLVLIVIVAKAIALGLLWVLPGEGVTFQKRASLQPPYERYNFGIAPPVVVKPKVRTAPPPKVFGLVLKGVYRTKKGGYAIVASKANLSQSEVLSIGEVFKDTYKLVEMTTGSAVFERGGVKETLWLEKPKVEAGSQSPGISTEAAPALQQLSRKDIGHYSKNLDQVWKDIGIVEFKKAGKIEGFKVVRIRKGSLLSKTGLEKGDVIIRANNKPLNSYAYAMELYQKIGTLKALELVVRRNNQEKELLYEIH